MPRPRRTTRPIPPPPSLSASGSSPVSSPRPAARPDSVRLGGKDAPPTEIGESVEVLYPVGRRDPVAIYDGIRGYEGTVSGWVMSANDLHVLEGIKSTPSKVVRLVMGDLNIPVQLGQNERRPLPDGDGPVPGDGGRAPGGRVQDQGAAPMSNEARRKLHVFLAWFFVVQIPSRSVCTSTTCTCSTRSASSTS